MGTKIGKLFIKNYDTLRSSDVLYIVDWQNVTDPAFLIGQSERNKRAEIAIS